MTDIIEAPKLKIGLYNENFKISKQEILEVKLDEVRNEKALFSIYAGPLLFQGESLKETYILEIHYKTSEDGHRKKLPLNGFNSQLCFDYAEKAHELASDFCDRKGFTINNHLNSWPVYQAVISKKEKENKNNGILKEDMS